MSSLAYSIKTAALIFIIISVFLKPSYQVLPDTLLELLSKSDLKHMIYKTSLPFNKSGGVLLNVLFYLGSSLSCPF